MRTASCLFPGGSFDSDSAEDRLTRILLRQFQYHSPCRSKDLPGQENVFQPEGLNLLPVFRFHAAIHCKQQEQIVGHHYQKVFQQS
jgi:hypothetical protein